MIDFHNDIAILEAGICGVAAAVDTVYKDAVWRVEEEEWIFEPVDGFCSKSPAFQNQFIAFYSAFRLWCNGDGYIFIISYYVEINLLIKRHHAEFASQFGHIFAVFDGHRLSVNADDAVVWLKSGFLRGAVLLRI